MATQLFLNDELFFLFGLPAQPHTISYMHLVPLTFCLLTSHEYKL